MTDSIIIQARADDTIDSITHDACRIATALERNVEYEFEGEKLIVAPYAHPAQIVQTWKRLKKKQ